MISLGSRGVTEDVEPPRNSPLLLATALRLLRLLCTERDSAQSGEYLHSVSGEAADVEFTGSVTKQRERAMHGLGQGDQ